MGWTFLLTMRLIIARFSLNVARASFLTLQNHGHRAQLPCALSNADLIADASTSLNVDLNFKSGRGGIKAQLAIERTCGPQGRSSHKAVDLRSGVGSYEVECPAASTRPCPLTEPK